tara:strand:+ start:1016 stop:3169 length:2154 start_codon:yes stop_codon:yes gene_type:complete
MPDKQILADGDTNFIGINMRSDPASLEPGLASDARNIVFRRGVAETRRGFVKPAWLNKVDPSESGSEINPWGAIYGVSTYKDPEAVEYVILAADGGVYFCTENNLPVSIPLPTGVKVLSDVIFVQAFNKVLMFRGQKLAPLVMSNVDDGFVDLIDHWDSTGETTYTASTSEVAWGPWKGITSITHDSGVATVTLGTNHGYITGADITIKGATNTEFNGRFNITVTGEATFTYSVTSSNSSAGGTITCSNMQNYWKADSGYTAGNEPGITNWTQLTTILPNSDIAEFIQNRIVVGTSFNTSTMDYTTSKKDFLFATDLLDYQHVFFTSQFRINEGSDDELVDLLKLNDNQLAVFKGKSCYLLTQVTSDADISSSVKLETLIPNYGTPSKGAVVMVGSDVYFYAGRRGIVSMKQTEQGKVQGIDIPISESIQPLIDRIDPRYENLIRLAYADNKLFCAIPLDDGSDGNNCCLVYDFLNRSWSGRYDGTAVNIKEFFKAYFKGSERLFSFSNDGFVNLLDESDHGDEVRDTDRDNNIGIEEITSELTTRGYHHNDLNQRFFKNVRVSVGTWNPQYTFNVIMDGANERKELASNRTKSRTSYYRPFDAAPFDTRNINSDFNTPYREDYSALVGTSYYLTTEDNNPLTDEDGNLLTTEGSEWLVPGSSLTPFSFQETQESFQIPVREGRFSQLEVSNNKGRIKIKQAIMTTETGAKGIQVKS